jgi:hypothetical protein
VIQVRFNRAPREPQPACDLAVCQAAGHELGNLVFATAEAVGSLHDQTLSVHSKRVKGDDQAPSTPIKT